MKIKTLCVRAVFSMLVALPMINIANAQQVVADVIKTTHNVSASTGAFTYEVPLELPPGVNDLMPKLSITYNSQAGNGLMGIGWNIAGLSSITRSTSSIYLNEAVADPIDYDNNDVFMLDGQRLIPDPNLPGISYTETKNFARIQQWGNSGQGPAYFTVEYLNGLMYEYGNTGASKFYGVPAQDILTWAVNKISDRNGNYIEFEYSSTGYGDFKISSIHYGGNSTVGTPNNIDIYFNHVDRTDDNQTWIAGHPIYLDNILTSIEVQHNGNMQRRYEFWYSTDKYARLTEIKEILPNNYVMPTIDITWGESTPTSPITGPVQTSIGSNAASYNHAAGDFDGDGATDVIKYLGHATGSTPGELYLSDKNDNFIQKPADDAYGTNGYTIKVGKTRYPGLQQMKFDWDGDGDDDVIFARTDVPVPGNVRLDLMLFKYDPGQDKFVYHSLIMRYGPIGGTSTPWTGQAMIIPGDYDGDGKSEILFGYPHIQTQSGMVVKYDLFIVGEEYPCVPLTNGNLMPHLAYSNVGSINGSHYVGGAFAMDIDGDGTDELVRSENNSLNQLKVYDILTKYKKNYTPFTDPQFRVDNPANSVVQIHASQTGNYNYIYPGDFNGDGNGDILVFSLPTNQPTGPMNGAWWIEYSKGASSFGTLFDKQQLPTNVNLYAQGASGPIADYYIADFDGDGKSDILQLKGNSPSPNTDWLLYYSKGYNEFASDNGSIAGFDIDRCMVGDFNGDGQADLLTSYQPTGWTPNLFYFHKDEHKYTVSSIKNADHEISIESSVLSKDPDYEQLWTSTSGTLQYPYYERPIPKRVTKRVADNYGNESEYQYKNFILNSRGLGVRGFMYSWEHDISASKTMVSEFSCLDQNTVAYLMKHEVWDASTYNDVVNNVLPPFPTTKPITQTEYEMTDEAGDPSGKSRLIMNRSTITRNFADGTYSWKDINNSVLNGGPNTSFYEIGAPENITTVTYVDPNTSLVHTEVNTYNLSAPWVWWGKPIQVTNTSSVAGTSSYSRTTEYTYDNLGRINTKITDPGTGNDLQTTFNYDNFGNIISKTQVPSIGTAVSDNYTYTPDGRFKESITNAMGYVELYTTDPVWGLRTEKTDKKGLTTTYEYDEVHRIVKTTSPTGMETFYFYDWAGNNFFKPSHSFDYEKPRFSETQQVVGYSGSVITFNDFDGNIIREAKVAFDGSVLFEDNRYNKKGLLVEYVEPHGSILNPNPVTTTYTYDDMDRLSSKTVSNGGPSLTVSYSLLTIGNNPIGMETTTSNVGQGTFETVSTNAVGKIFKKEDNNVSTIEYSYASNGEYDEIKLNSSPQYLTQYTYDAFGNLIAETEPNLGTKVYSYDTYGQIVGMTDGKGATTNYTYDAIGRVVSKTDPDGTYTYTYDNSIGSTSLGELLHSTSPYGNFEFYEYDNFGRMNVHDYYSKRSEYEYDMYGRLIRQKNAVGDIYHYLYNQYSYLYQVNIDQGQPVYPSGYSYTSQTLYKINGENHLGQVTQAEYYDMNNQPIYIEDKTYDPHGNLYTHEVTNALSTNVIYSHEYAYNNNNGNLNSREDMLRGFREDFSYDSEDRLTYVNYNGVIPNNLQMTYSAEGNIKKKSDVTPSIYTWKYNQYALDHVPEPNISSPSFVLPVATQTNTWYPFNKVKEIDEENYKLQFNYGPSQQRVSMAMIDPNAGSQMVMYRSYAPGYDLIARDWQAQPRTIEQLNYVLAGDRNIAISRLTSTDYQNPPITAYSTSLYFTITDHLGSLVMLLDNDGNINDGIVEERSYDAWGRVRDANTWQYIIGDPNWITYRGFNFHEHVKIQYYDFVNMNGRLYSPITGQMYSPDPIIANPNKLDGYHKYAYALNNPLKYVDPDGKEPIAAGVIIVAAVVGAGTNVAFNYKRIDNFGDFAGYALVGALAGAAGGYAGAGVAAAVGVGGFGGGFASGMAAGAAGGFVSGAGNAYMGGASFTDGLKAGLVSGVYGAASGAIVGGIAGSMRSVSNGTEQYNSTIELDELMADDPNFGYGMSTGDDGVQYLETTYSSNEVATRWGLSKGNGLNSSFRVRSSVRIYKHGDSYFADVSATAKPFAVKGKVTFGGRAQLVVDGKVKLTQELTKYNGGVIMQTGYADVGYTKIGLPNAASKVSIKLNVGYMVEQASGRGAVRPLGITTPLQMMHKPAYFRHHY